MSFFGIMFRFIRVHHVIRLFDHVVIAHGVIWRVAIADGAAVLGFADGFADALYEGLQLLLVRLTADEDKFVAADTVDQLRRIGAL